MSAFLTGIDPVTGSEPGEPAVARHYGVLPWRLGRKGELRILLVSGGERQGWSVPRGRPVEGRVPFMAAALEAFEKAGIIGDIDPRPLVDYRCRQPGDDGEAGGPCHVTLFAMRVRGTLSHWKQRGERQRQWFTAAEAADRLEPAELGGLVRALAGRPGALTDKAGRLTAAADPS